MPEAAGFPAGFPEGAAGLPAAGFPEEGAVGFPDGAGRPFGADLRQACISRCVKCCLFVAKVVFT